MYVEIFNRDLFGPEKPIIVDSNEYGIKERYTAARNFIINTIFNGRVNVDRIIVIKHVEPILYKGCTNDIGFDFNIDKFTNGRVVLIGRLIVNSDNMVIKYELGKGGKEDTITSPGYPFLNMGNLGYIQNPMAVPTYSANNLAYKGMYGTTGYQKPDPSFKIDIGDNGSANEYDGMMHINLDASVNEGASQLNINNPSVISSVLDDVRKINNPKE